MYAYFLFILDFAGWMAIIGAACAITMLIGTILVYIFGTICNKIGQAIEFLKGG